jgi:hypothetical protein
MSPSRYRGVWLLPLLVAGLLPIAARGGDVSSTTPLAVDFKRAPVGSWAEYTIKVGTAVEGTMKIRWAFLGRDAGSNTLELTMEGLAAASPKLGGKVVTRMVLVPDPVGATRPFRQIVMQLGDAEPMEVPLEMTGLPAQKFQNPDPKKMVGKQTMVVGTGSFQTSHYHDVLPDSVVDSWLSTEVPPLGVVKILSTPKLGAEGPGGKPLPTVTMELVAHGTDARPTITRAVRRFDPEGGEKN